MVSRTSSPRRVGPTHRKPTGCLYALDMRSRRLTRNQNSFLHVPRAPSRAKRCISLRRPCVLESAVDLQTSGLGTQKRGACSLRVLASLKSNKSPEWINLDMARCDLCTRTRRLVWSSSRRQASSHWNRRRRSKSNVRAMRSRAELLEVCMEPCRHIPSVFIATML